MEQSCDHLQLTDGIHKSVVDPYLSFGNFFCIIKSIQCHFTIGRPFCWQRGVVTDI